MVGNARRDGSSRRSLVLPALVALTLIAAGCAYYLQEAGEIRAQEFETLAAVARLNSDLAARWRAERVADARLLAADPHVEALLEALLRAPGDRARQGELRERLRLERETNVYREALVLAPDGQVLLSTASPVAPVNAATQRAVTRALLGPSAVLSDLFRGPDGDATVDVVIAELDGAGRAIAVLVLRASAGSRLLPLMRARYTPHPSAEVLLVQRERGDLVYLAEPGGRGRRPLAVRVPVSRAESPAAHAALGQQGSFDGTNERGARVLADLRRVPGSQWYVVAQVDAHEALAESRYRAAEIATLVVLLLLLGGSLLRWRARQAQLLRGLTESERRRRAAEAVGHVGSYFCDVPGDAWTCSSELDSILGIDAAYARTSAGWASLLHPAEREAVIAHLRGVLLERRRFERECRIVRASDGVERWVLALGEVEYASDGSPLRMVGTVQDVTERKTEEATRARLEDDLRQSQKMEAVGRLAGGVAHDFNNLLTVIINTADLALASRHEGDPLAADLREVLGAAERAAALTKRLLTFSRRQVVKEDVVRLSRLVENLRPMLARILGDDLVLNVVGAESLGCVRADVGQLEQVVMNLAINARDAMPSGGTLTFETRRVDVDEAYLERHASARPGPHVMLRVSDTGTGMDEATRARVFEPFFTTKELGKGTGLGLATVYGIVERSGGSVEVQSELGRGTTFTIWLPLASDEPTAEAPAPARKVVSGNETVLLVEDEPAVLRAAARIMRLAGYSVLTATGGVEALQLLARREDRVDVMLTDVMMPGMGGRELASKVRELRPEVKVLFTSGLTDDAALLSGAQGGATHFLSKPYQAAELTGVVRAVLDSRDAAPAP